MTAGRHLVVSVVVAIPECCPRGTTRSPGLGPFFDGPKVPSSGLATDEIGDEGVGASADLVAHAGSSVVVAFISVRRLFACGTTRSVARAFASG